MQNLSKYIPNYLIIFKKCTFFCYKPADQDRLEDEFLDFLGNNLFFLISILKFLTSYLRLQK
jgi:hypothetical protein